MDLLGYAFLKRAALACVLAGAGCSLAGVFVVGLRIPIIGVTIAHAALLGAAAGAILGLPVLPGAVLFSLICGLSVGPISDRSRLDPNISLGFLSSLLMGLAFALVGFAEDGEQSLMGLVWGNVLTVTAVDLSFSLLVLLVGIFLLTAYYAPLHALLISRRTAAALGLPEKLMMVGLYLYLAAAISVNLDVVGGLMLFSLILNPAAAAYLITWNFKLLLLLSALFGVLSSLAGLALSCVFNLPSGACIVIASSLVFAVAAVFGKKRREASEYGR